MEAVWKYTGSRPPRDGQRPGRARLQTRFMTVQSSFLIRCTLHTSGDPTSGKAYDIRHIQTGAAFRSATLEEVTRWVADQNLRYLSDTMSAPSGQDFDVPEDIL
jgi:hypothetical protein